MSKDITEEPIMTVTVSMARYEELIKQEYKLICLENGGVDNWEWYGESLEQGGYFKYLEED